MSYRSFSLALLIAVSASGCTPIRRSLPTPYPNIMGATPISTEGFALGFELADGVRGQELQQTETRGLVISAGFANRFGASLSGLTTSLEHVNATSLRVKARVARPFGARTALGIHLGLGGSQRRDSTVQNEVVKSGEVALPLEAVVAEPSQKVWLSAYLAPRVISEKYTDKIAPQWNLSAVISALTTGFHLRAAFLDTFFEVTFSHVPANTYKGTVFPSRVLTTAAAALTFRIGQPYNWHGK